MDTSLRYNSASKALRIHAKQKLPIDSDTFLQVHGELDTRYGSPNYFCAMLRRFYNQPQLSSSLGVGVQFDKHEKLGYVVRGKMAFPVTSNDSISFNVKGRCDVDKEFKQRRSIGGAEFTWSIFNFQKEQDVRFKVGYDIVDKVPYMQFRENNWTVNADAKGRWNVRYDL
ncbi:Outer envelope pore protein 21B chloroplastic [Bienertia sinuspersici]